MSNIKYDKWIRTHNAQGFEPNFLISCPRCIREAKVKNKKVKEENFKMFLRNSTLGHETRQDTAYPKTVPVCKMLYKCKYCDYTEWFYIQNPYLDIDYWGEMYAYRERKLIYVPPMDEFNEDEIIRKKLEALGYM